MDRKKPQVELLAPASGMDGIRAAVFSGADAVYTGGSSFGARAYADNLACEQLTEAIDFVHLHGKKLYLTVNTLLKEKELEEELVSFLMPYYRQGLDAVIVQDTGVFCVIKQYFPDLPIHVSTQAVCTGAGSARAYEKLGAARIVTARELSLEEIQEIRKETGLEIESFVHGALCYCYSGQCLFSSFAGGRSGNRGRCAQPCRLPYDLYDSQRNKINDKQEKYLLSPKDICTLDILPEIIEAGVFSLKIEGRMKRPEYTAGVTAIYRKYVDLYLEKGKEGYAIDDRDRQHLMDLYNRGGFHSGYYTKHNGKDMMAMVRPNHNGVHAGTLVAKKNGFFMRAEIHLHKEDVLEFRGVWDKKLKKELELVCTREVLRGQTYVLPEKYRFLFQGQNKVEVYRTKNEAFLQEIRQTYLVQERKIPLRGRVKVAAGKPAVLQLICAARGTEEIVCVQETKEAVQEADKQPVRADDIKRQLTKTGESEFIFEELSVEMEGACFIPLKQLNQLRRDGLIAVRQAAVQSFRRTVPASLEHASFKKACQPLKDSRMEDYGAGMARCLACAMVETIEQMEVILQYPQIDRLYVSIHAFTGDAVPKGQGREACGKAPGLLQLNRAVKQCREAGKAFYLVLPAVWRMDNCEKLSAAMGFQTEAETKEGLKRFLDGLAAQIDGIVAKNMEVFTIAKICSAGKALPIHLDFTAYAMNAASIQCWKELGAASCTFQPELNKGELYHLAKKRTLPMELVIYGHMPMMVSAQCPVRNTKGCSQKKEILHLKDRKGNRHFVINYCDTCYSIIYNSDVLSYIDMRQEVRSLNPDSVRLQFNIESAPEVKQVMDCFAAGYTGEEKQVQWPEKVTRGHWKRGVE